MEIIFGWIKFCIGLIIFCIGLLGFRVAAKGALRLRARPDERGERSRVIDLLALVDDIIRCKWKPVLGEIQGRPRQRNDPRPDRRGREARQGVEAGPEQM